MAKTYFLDGASSDFTLGGQFTQVLDPATGSSATNQIVATSGGGTESGYYVEPSDTGVTRTSTGTFSQEVDITTPLANTQMRVQWHRVDSGGTIQASSGYTSYQATTAAGILDYSDTATGLGTWATTDRLAVELQVQNNRAHGGTTGPTHEIETTDSEAVTPFTVVTTSPITAVIPGIFGVVADLKADGKLDAAREIEYAVVASLLGDGKLDAALAAEFNITAVIGSAPIDISAALPIEYSIVANLIADGDLNASLPIEYNIVANLIAGGKLDATLPIEYSVVASLIAQGKLDAVLATEFNVIASIAAGINAVLPIEYNVIADLKADGLLSSVPQIEFAAVSDLKGQGKIDAVLAIEYGIIADLTASQGAIAAILPIEYSVVASLLADGKLISAPSILFNLTGSLLSATAGSLSSTLPIEFNTAANIINSNIPTYPFIDRRHIGPFIN